MQPTRRLILAGGAASLLAACTSPSPRALSSEISIYSAGQGSAFLPYAQGMAAYLTAQGMSAKALESKGSIDNLGRVDAEPNLLGLAFLGTAFEAVNGSAPWTLGRKHSNVRALFPMYETSFQIVAMRASGFVKLRDLVGKRVGTGPKGGPAEAFFNGLAEVTGVTVQTVAGTPSALVADLQAGRIDALWQGASVPIPALKQVTDTSDAVVFGLGDDELSAMLKRFPFLSPASVAPNTYRGQSTGLKSVAAWNFVIAHKDLPEADAYRITRAVLSAPDPKAIHSSAGPTRAVNARNNSVVPFHEGALRFYREQGVSGLKQ